MFSAVPKPLPLVLQIKIMTIYLWKPTMSDDEDLAPAVKKQRIHFGSLETVERERLVTGSSNDNDDDRKDDDDQEAEGEDNEVSAAVLAGIRAGNINISEGKLLIIILQLVNKSSVLLFRRYYLLRNIVACFVVTKTSLAVYSVELSWF